MFRVSGHKFGVILSLIVSIFIVVPAGYAHASAAAGKVFNPDISANFLGLVAAGTDLSNDRTQSPHNGFSLQEAEVQIVSDVDPYFRGSVLLAIAQAAGSTEFAVDPEEVYLETISLPMLTIRAGKFKLALGKHNLLHTHVFPFIDSPLINQELMGEEGLNEAAISMDLLQPH